MCDPQNKEEVLYVKYIEPYVCSYHRAHGLEVEFSGCSCTSGFWVGRPGTIFTEDTKVDFDVLDELFSL